MSWNRSGRQTAKEQSGRKTAKEQSGRKTATITKMKNDGMMSGRRHAETRVDPQAVACVALSRFGLD